MGPQQIPDEERGEMTIRFPCRTVAGVGLIGLLAAFSAPEAHADDGTDHAGFTLGGTPVSGGTNLGDATELTPNAAYVDEFVHDQVLYYRIPREMEGSTLHVSLTTPHDGSEDMDVYSMALGTWDGEDCASTTDSGMVTETGERLRTSHISTGVAAGEAAEDLDEDEGDLCGEADELVLAVGEDWDEDDMGDRPFELLIYEEPSNEEAEEMAEEPSYSDLDWTEMGRDISGSIAAEPGNDFTDVPSLEAGSTYDTTITPGEVQIYSIPMQWGEYLQAEAYFPDTGAVDSVDNVSLAVMNPLRGLHDGEYESLSFGDTTELRTASDPVNWSNRYDSWASSTLAGEYYLVVTADGAGSSEDEEAELDYLLTLQTYDWEDADTAAPAYADGLTDAQPPFGPQNEVAAAEAAEEEERAQMTALERVRSMGESTGLVMSMGAFALLMMATGSLFMVRAIRQHQRNNP